MVGKDIESFIRRREKGQEINMKISKELEKTLRREFNLPVKKSPSFRWGMN